MKSNLPIYPFVDYAFSVKSKRSLPSPTFRRYSPHTLKVKGAGSPEPEDCHISESAARASRPSAAMVEKGDFNQIMSPL